MTSFTFVGMKDLRMLLAGLDFRKDRYRLCVKTEVAVSNSSRWRPLARSRDLAIVLRLSSLHRHDVSDCFEEHRAT